MILIKVCEAASHGISSSIPYACTPELQQRAQRQAVFLAGSPPILWAGLFYTEGKRCVERRQAGAPRLGPQERPPGEEEGPGGGGGSALRDQSDRSPDGLPKARLYV
ncbi:hypothetical protein NHX12_005647, partial [Muraenolepis orangiensis]